MIYHHHTPSGQSMLRIFFEPLWRQNISAAGYRTKDTEFINFLGFTSTFCFKYQVKIDKPLGEGVN